MKSNPGFSRLFFPSFRAFCSAALLFLLSACGDKENTGNPSDGGTYQITATVGMIADIVRNVAGNHASVTGIIGEGIDPHLYKPTAPDVKALQAADVIFYNGLMLEGKMSDILVRTARTGKPVFAVTEEIQNDSNYVMSDEAQHFDPHVWMDVSGWIRAVDVIEKSLSAHDPDHAEDYKNNASAYREKLKKLDAYAKEAISSIPAEQRVLVTAHDAFNYMARAYGLEVKGIQGVSTESEAGVKDIEDLVTFLVESKIPAVFVETSVSDKNIRALIEGCNAKGHKVVIGGELFSDAMGSTGTYEGTYIGMIDHNITTITRALGGTAPEKGLNEKLSH